VGLAMMLKCWETRSRISSFPGGVASLVSLASLGLTSSLHSPHEMRNEICEAGGTAPWCMCSAVLLRVAYVASYLYLYSSHASR